MGLSVSRRPVMDGFYTLGTEPELRLAREIGDTGKINDRGQFPTHLCLSMRLSLSLRLGCPGGH